MVARLIHRYTIEDRLFPGAEAATPASVASGARIVFGIAGDGEPAARALRDAAAVAVGDAAPPRFADLGNLRVSNANGVAYVTALTASLVAKDCTPILLGGTLEDAAAMGAGSAYDGLILISSGLAFRARSGAVKLAIGTNDLVPIADYAGWTDCAGEFVTAAACESADPGAIRDAVGRLRTKSDRVFLVVDLGAVDTGYAAGTDALNVGGLAPLDIFAAVEALGPPAAMAVVNLAPERDPRGHSEQIGAQAILRAFAAS